MAEDVNVIGTPGLQAWASEATLKNILAVLEETSKLTEEQLKDLRKKSTEFNSNIDETFNDIDDALNDLEGSTEDLISEIEGLGEAADDTRQETEDLGKTMKKFNIGVLAPLAGGMGLLAGGITKQMNMVTELNEAGLNLGRNIDGAVGGFNSFVTSATEANLTMSELADISKKYGTMMNNIGVKQFGPMAKSLTADLRGLGVTSSEGAELLAEYLEQQQTLGVTNRMSQQEQTKQAAKQIKQADLWGKTLGLSRKEMLGQMKGMKENVDINAFLNRSSANVQQAFEQMQMGLSGFDANTSSSIMQSLATPIIQTSDLFKQLNDAGMSEAANELVNMQKIVTDPNVDPMAAEKAMDDFLKVVSAQDTNLAQIITGSETALALVQEAKTRGLLTKAQESELEAQQKQAAAMAKAQDTMKQFTQMFDRAIGNIFGNQALVDQINGTLEEMSSAFEAIVPPVLEVASMLAQTLAPVIVVAGKALGAIVTTIAKPLLSVASFLTDVLKGFIESIEYFGGLISDAISPILDSISEWFTPIGEAISSAFDTLMSPFSELGSESSELVTNFGKLALGIGTFVAIMAAKTKIMSGIGLAKSMFGGGSRESSTRGPSGGGGAGMLGALGKGIGDLGKGIGKGIGGIFEGLAMGLRAFAYPKILLGATIFAGALTVISGGLSLSAKILSWAMPDLAEGLQSFEVIDAEKISAVGGAMLDLAAGAALLGPALALFAVGSAVASVGSVINGIADSFLGLLGVESPTDQLMKFAEVGPQMKDAGIGVLALTRGLDGLGDAVGKLPDLDMLKGIIDATNKADPAKMLAFAEAMSQQASAPVRLEIDDTALKNLGSVQPEGFIKLVDSLGLVMRSADPFGKFVNDFEKLGNLTVDLDVDAGDFRKLALGINYFKTMDESALAKLKLVGSELKDFNMPSLTNMTEIDDADLKEFVNGISYFDDLDINALASLKLIGTELKDFNMPSLTNMTEIDDADLKEFVVGINYFKSMDTGAVDKMKNMLTELSGTGMPDFSKLNPEGIVEMKTAIQAIANIKPEAIDSATSIMKKLNEVTISPETTTGISDFSKTLTGMKASLDDLTSFDGDLMGNFVESLAPLHDLDLAWFSKLERASEMMASAAHNLNGIDAGVLSAISASPGGSLSKITEKSVSQVAAPITEEREKGQKPTTKDQVGNPANKELNVKESEINTILARQTELLEMILVNSSSQLDNVKKLRRSSEERT